MKRLTPILLASMLAACSGNGNNSMMPPPAPYQGTLDVDIRNKVDVTLQPGADGTSFTVSLSFKDGSFLLFDQAQPLKATGRIEPFPEASIVLYTAHFSSAAIPAGPCGMQPISLALALSRRDNNDRIGGALTAYCGADTWYGVPARVLRLMGKLPPVAAM